MSNKKSKKEFDMNSIKKLNEKFKRELHLKEEYDEDDEVLSDEELDDLEDEQEEEEDKKQSKARIRLETESKIKGIIKNLDFEMNYRDFADRVNDEVDGVVLTREKAHQVFNIVRDFLGF